MTVYNGMQSSRHLLLILLLVVFWSCQNQKTVRKDTLFQLVSSDSSGIDFVNRITPDDSINILTYEYLYNGGGVGIGDFNKDGLPDVVLTGNRVPCRLYINKGDFHFEDITSSSGINTAGVWAYGVSIADVNQDGFPDIYISAGGVGNKDIFPNKLFINNGDLTFREAAKEYGLDDHGESIQAAFLDYDKDGDLDMYLLTGGGFERSAVTPRPLMKDGSNRNTDRLYRNDYDEKLGHPVFTDVSKEANIIEDGFGLGVSVLDINDDGWPDVYVTNDYLSPDLLYINNKDGTFSESASHYFKHTSHFAMGNDAGDVNNDGLTDIVALDMLPEDHYRHSLMFGPNQYDRFYIAVNLGYGYQYMRNTLQLNNGNGSFSEIGQLAGIYKTDWSWAPLLADLDNDGYQDIFITNGFGKDITDLDFVKFKTEINPNDAARKKVLTDSLALRPGIKVANYGYKNNGDNTFSKKSSEWGFDLPSYSNGSAYADLDNDGDLDLIVNNINDKAFVFRNTLNEKNDSTANYLRVTLKGPPHNQSATGSKVQIKYDHQVQVRYQSMTRGFMSSVEPFLHFGLGSAKSVDTLRVTWPDGKVSVLVNVPANQLIQVDYNNSVEPENTQGSSSPTYFTALPSNLIPYRHIENNFNDFNYQSLLPHKLSQQGPGIATGDINGDGREDIFVGGAYHQPGYFFIQQSNGTFKTRPFSTGDDLSEDMGCLLFDADNDHDLDLYVVSGGNEYYKGHERYQDRLYINDGKGDFVKSKDALPTMLSSGSCVVAGDYDQDGDLDLFVGGRVVPGSYPEAPESYVLQNNRGKFTDVTEALMPGLQHIGMITDARWTDFNNDHQLDLVLTGEAMPLTLLMNRQGSFSNAIEQAGLKDTDGFWNSLVAGDFDNDGDIDYVAGNLGLNSPYKVSAKEPMTICYADYDNNGSVEPFIGCYEDGVSYPVPSLDILTQQVPLLKKHILYYRDYARTTTEQLITLTGTKEYKTLYCKTFQTTLFENKGDGTFNVKPLPREMQLAPVYGMVTTDINGDGNTDLLAVGNSYSNEVVSGRYDAMIGLALLGDGNNNFKPLNLKQSGFFVDGDAKGIARCETSRGSLFVVTQNNDSLKVLKPTEAEKSKRLFAKPGESYAILTMEDGRKQKAEFYYGTTYLSQSSRSIVVTAAVQAVGFYDGQGKLLRKVDVN